MNEDQLEITNTNENNNEKNEEDNDKPFVKLDNIDSIPSIKNEEKNDLNLGRNLNLKPSEITEEDISISSNTESVENSKKDKQEEYNSKKLYEESKKKLEPYQLKMLYTIKNIEEMVKTGERQRNYKLKSEFEREKEYKLEEQDEIKNKIIELSKNNINEKLINHFNIRIEKQEELYNQFDEMKSDILNKIELIKSAIPPLEKNVKEKNERLKNLNKNNLKLLDKINELENDNNNNNNNNSKNNNISTNMNNSQYGNNSSVILNNSSQLIGNQSTNFLNNSDKFPKGIKINEIVRDNEDIKNQYHRILELKKEYKFAKSQNQKMIKSINEMSMDCFLFKKIFNEGMNEIGRELLKIHELKLDKVINGTNPNKNSSSLYFQIVKTQTNGNETKNDDILKLPLINKNIIEKYNYPIVEKSEPKTLIYNAIKHVYDANYKETKNSNMKKNRIDWEEFKNFSSYQIYTILNMNKDIIKKLEGNIFPRKLIFPMSNKEEESINLKDDNIDTNELIEDDDF